jgi:hypothetical protein
MRQYSYRILPRRSEVDGVRPHSVPISYHSVPSMPKPLPLHRWAIDGLEESTARIEEDGHRIITVPRWLLPAEAREGQILTVTRAAASGSSTVTFTIDEGATSAAKAKSGAQVEKIAKASKRRDGGGDVAL